MDRRNLFAKMKFNRPPSIRESKLGGTSTHSQLSSVGGDGMPDIHMVGSQMSLHSTLSNMTDGNNPKHSSTPSSGASKGQSMVETARVVDHSRQDYMDVLAIGSKHSLMSGLSRISDNSANDSSIFSNLTKSMGPVGNVSTRSIAMSEISLIDVAERETEDDEDDED